MSSFEVIRPLVRSFSTRQLSSCAAHVKSGGHAALWDPSNGKAWLVTPVPNADDPQCLHHAAMMDVRKVRWVQPTKGPLKGIALTLVQPRYHWILKDRTLRDANYKGSKRRIQLDCLACGACCHHMEVPLEDDDMIRFKNAGRHDLLKSPHVVRRKGKLFLPVHRKHGRCHKLGEDYACSIYEIRPDPCRNFPAGSEGCLFAREELHGWVDGLPSQHR